MTSDMVGGYRSFVTGERPEDTPSNPLTEHTTMTTTHAAHLADLEAAYNTAERTYNTIAAQLRKFDPDHDAEWHFLEIDATAASDAMIAAELAYNIEAQRLSAHSIMV